MGLPGVIVGVMAICPWERADGYRSFEPLLRLAKLRKAVRLYDLREAAASKRRRRAFVLSAGIAIATRSLLWNPLHPNRTRDAQWAA